MHILWTLTDVEHGEDPCGKRRAADTPDRTSVKKLSSEVLVGVNIDHNAGCRRDNVRSGCSDCVQKHLVLSLLDRSMAQPLKNILLATGKEIRQKTKFGENVCTCDKAV